MTDKNNTLVAEPSVFVVGQTSFNMPGMNAWLVFNGLDQAETYIGSPIQNIMDGATLSSDDQMHGELMSEFAGRFCYNSFLKGRDSADYIENVLEMRHGSVLEHVTVNLAIQGVSRALTHELVRHRAGFAISQESQRYVDAKDIKFVIPPALLDVCGGDLNHPAILQFQDGCERDLADYVSLQETIYNGLLTRDGEVKGVKEKTMLKKRANEAARSRLPNAAETKLTWTGNLRSLRHFCELRGEEHADLEIRRLATAIAERLMEVAPYTFTDFSTFEGSHGVGTVKSVHQKV